MSAPPKRAARFTNGLFFSASAVGLGVAGGWNIVRAVGKFVRATPGLAALLPLVPIGCHQYPVPQGYLYNLSPPLLLSYPAVARSREAAPPSTLS